MKKVLIITYYWPPAGGPGVQRWLKFVKYLRDFGIEPIVYIPENPDYPLIDPSLQQEIPADIKILRKKIFEPYSLARLLSRKETATISAGIIAEEEKQNWLQSLLLYIRGNLFIPDARKFWIRPSVNFLSDYISENKIDTIITTGPPHSLHLIGSGIKAATGVNWVADFRDPWTQIGYHKKLKLSKRSKTKHLRLERKVLTEANHILTTSFTTKAEFQEKTSSEVSVITNGYEEYDLPEVQRDEAFSMSHIGSLLSGRNPANLWKCLSEIKRRDLEFSKMFRLKLAGAVSEEVLASIKKHGLEENLILLGYVSHRQALDLQRSSQVLLLIEIDSVETRGIIPGKLFEYLAAKRPILSIGPVEWDVAQILDETGAGSVFSHKSMSDLKQCILNYFRAYQEGNLEVNSSNIEKYTRKNLTARLAEILKEQ